MRFEQPRQSVGLLCQHGREGARGRPFAHTPLNAWRPRNVGAMAAPASTASPAPRSPGVWACALVRAE
jgi:hypothetical protein